MSAQTVVEQHAAELYRRTAAAGLGIWAGGAFTAHPGMDDEAGDFVRSLLRGVPLGVDGDDR